MIRTMRYDLLGNVIARIRAARDNIRPGESYQGVFIIWDYDNMLHELESVVDSIKDADEKERISRLLKDEY